jgi:hypothetical protein
MMRVGNGHHGACPRSKLARQWGYRGLADLPQVKDLSGRRRRARDRQGIVETGTRVSYQAADQLEFTSRCWR